MARRGHRLGDEALLRDHLRSRSGASIPATRPPIATLRLRGLKEHPDAFTSSYEEESAKPLAATERRIAPDSADAVFGAFVGGALVGVVGLAREPRVKNRHKAVVFGMYVAPEHGGRGIGTALLRHVIGEASRRARSRATRADRHASPTMPRARCTKGAASVPSAVEPRAIRVGDTVFRQEPHDPCSWHPHDASPGSAFPPRSTSARARAGSSPTTCATQGIRTAAGRHRPRHRAAAARSRSSSASLAGLDAAVYSEIWGNPVAARSASGAAAFRAHDADAVIGLGGGAALDVAKAIALMATHPGDVLEYAWDHPQRAPDRPARCPTSSRCRRPPARAPRSAARRSSRDDVTHVKKIIFSPKLLAKACSPTRS